MEKEVLVKMELLDVGGLVQLKNKLVRGMCVVMCSIVRYV